MGPVTRYKYMHTIHEFKSSYNLVSSSHFIASLHLSTQILLRIDLPLHKHLTLTHNFHNDPA